MTWFRLLTNIFVYYIVLFYLIEYGVKARLESASNIIPSALIDNELIGEPVVKFIYKNSEIF